MTGDEVRPVFEAMVPQAASKRLCAQFGVIERQRKWPWGLLVRALVISAGPPGGAEPADLRRSELACAVPPVGRPACDRWCDEPLERVRAALAERSLSDARAQPVDLSGPLGGVTDGASVEVTTVRGRDTLRTECPAAPPAPRLAARRCLSVDRPSLCAAGGRGDAPVDEAGGMAHASWERPPVAPTPLRP